MGDSETSAYEVFIPKDDSPVTDEHVDGGEIIDFDTNNPADYKDMGGHEDDSGGGDSGGDGPDGGGADGGEGDGGGGGEGGGEGGGGE